MSKVTVYDVLETRRHLQRLENYSYRNMNDLPILEANENVVAARELLRKTLSSFMEVDVATLHADTSDIQRRIERYKEARRSWKERIESYTQQISDELEEYQNDPDLDMDDLDTEWYDERIRELKEDRRNYKAKIKELKAQL